MSRRACAHAARCENASTSSPRNRTSPDVGSISRRMQRPVVVLPLPDSPTRPNVSPSSIVKLTSSTARDRRAGCRTARCLRVNSLTRLRTSSERHQRRPRRPCGRGSTAGAVQIALHASARGPRRSRVAGMRRRARLEPIRAARRERAAGRQRAERRHRALDRAAAACPARRRESTPAGRACRDASGRRTDRRTGACSTMRPAYITATRSAISATTPRSCVMSSSARSSSRLQLAQQVEDLRLDRDVERRRRLVGDEQRRLAGERHRDQHALPHAAGQLMRIVVDARCGSGMLTASSSSIARCSRRRAASRGRARAASRRSGRRS